MAVEAGKMISLEYTLKDDAGNQIESNVGGQPLKYIHGAGQIVPGLEKALEGMEVDQCKQVTLSPSEGYGEVDAKAFVEVPKDKVPEEAHKVGAQLQTTDQDGQMMFSSVFEVKDKNLVLNFNHPLAGQTLHFDVKVLEVAEAAA